ncbi:hypothetical protein SEVIR_9G258150v4 [Setaria viridis]|uniref:Uncharacterized protein n=1 Tax=Setaria viridis TaxID=4556 RepID=A0A4U6T9Z3_SETVI|nr:hypothetical protein SEVIR_9G258150v2 [Setaria viridis]
MKPNSPRHRRCSPRAAGTSVPTTPPPPAVGTPDPPPRRRPSRVIRVSSLSPSFPPWLPCSSSWIPSTSSCIASPPGGKRSKTGKVVVFSQARSHQNSTDLGVLAYTEAVTLGVFLFFRSSFRFLTHHVLSILRLSFWVQLVLCS